MVDDSFSLVCSSFHAKRVLVAIPNAAISNATIPNRDFH